VSLTALFATGLVAFGLGLRPAQAAGTAGCPSTPGGRVVLVSDAADPEVFLWDSRDRLVDYAGGHWGSTRAIFNHTVLAEPGTQALITTCVPGAPHANYDGFDQDTVGVKIMTGPYRGRYGWVLSSDVRPTRGSLRSLNVVGSTPH
jgi:hypothetical protein